MTSFDISSFGIPAGQFKDNLETTLVHTITSISAAHKLLHDPKQFEEDYKVNISKLGCITTPFADLSMLMFIHDFYKLTEKSEHARKAAEFLDAPTNRALVRYHDILGIIHTGEASLLFLEPLIEFAGTLTYYEKRFFLNTLLMMTIVDVASLGFLNQARLETYQDVLAKIAKVLAGKSLLEVASEDTPQRIDRLIRSNNRFLIDPKLVDDRLGAYPDMKEFFCRLLYVRFDAGAYVLEPLLRYMVDPTSHPMSSETLVSLEGKHTAQIDKWITAVDRLLIKETTGQNNLQTLNLNDRSVKDPRNLPVFEQWARGF